MDRSLYIASTPMIALLSAAVAAARGGRSRLLIIEDFALAARLADLIERWPDNPFECIHRVPGRFDEHRAGAGDHPRGPAAAWHRARTKRRQRARVLPMVAQIDAQLRPHSVWVGNDRKVETQYALHLSCTRSGRAVGRYLDDGLYSYLGDVRTRPLVRRIDWLVKRIGYGRWWHHAAQAGTTPWIAESWLVFPDRALDRSAARRRVALPASLFAGRHLLRLCALAAQSFGVDRAALRRCALVLVLPHSNQLRDNPGLHEGLTRLVDAAAARGARTAIKVHPREHEADPGALARGDATVLLPALLPMELLLPLVPSGGVLVGEGSSALLAAHWLRPDLRVVDTGFSLGGYAARARALFESLGMETLAGSDVGVEGLLSLAIGAEASAVAAARSEVSGGDVAAVHVQRPGDARAARDAAALLQRGA